MKTDRFSVDIVTAEGRLPEYNEQSFDEDERFTHSSCWIPSEAGKPFHIDIWNQTHDYVEVRCFIDGRFLSRILIRPHEPDYVDGVQVTDSAVRPFVFSQVTLVDDENALIPTTYNPDKFGTIEVHIIRVIVREEYEWDRGQIAVSSPGPIPEKSKKAGYHQVSLGEAEVIPGESVFCVEAKMMDTAEKPRATFIFRYRPLAMLQAEGRTALPPTPTPAAVEPRITNKRARTDSPADDASDGQPSKRIKPEQSAVLYDSIDEIWQASMLLKPSFLHDQDLNVGLVDDELETLQAQRDALADQLKDVDTKIFEVSSRRSSRSFEPSPPSKKDLHQHHLHHSHHLIPIQALSHAEHHTFSMSAVLPPFHDSH